jgi:hypothetical protein
MGRAHIVVIMIGRKRTRCSAVELSALRLNELFPLLDSLDPIELQGFQHGSIHAPSQFETQWEAAIGPRLQGERFRQWPIIVHPDALTDFGLWREFGSLRCIENMDKRKPMGRTARELDIIFQELPEAGASGGIAVFRYRAFPPV